MRGRPVTSRAEYEHRESTHRATLAGVTAAHAGLGDAQERLRAAADDRAVAVYEARVAGVTLRRLGELLGMAHKNVLVLERRGAEIMAGGGVAPRVAPGAGGGIGAAGAAQGVAGEPDSSLAAGKHTSESDPGPACLREGCPLPAAVPHRFCRAHQWN